MQSRIVIINGSSRINGDTAQFVSYLTNQYKSESINLIQYNIGHYDYDHRNINDDYIPLVKKIINNYDLLVFATPVYWYNMSSIMKVFFDRITDLLTIEKELGRQLRGKSMASLSVSNSNDLESFFHKPFELSAEYLGMQYIGGFHAWTNNESDINKMKNTLSEWYETLIKSSMA